MITKQTAYDIWIAYDEIEKGNTLLADLEEQLKSVETINLRDCFGRQRPLQLGVPSGQNSHRLFDVHPKLAIEIIKAHVAIKKAELNTINERARQEV